MFKTLEQTPDRIRFVSDSPIWLTGLVGLAAIGILLLLGPSTEFECARTSSGEIDCQISRKLFGFTLSAKTIEGVEGASIQISQSSRRLEPGSGTVEVEVPSTRVLLQTAHGPVPVSSAYKGNRAQQKQTAAAINAFVQDNSRKMIAFSEPAGLLLWAVIVFVSLFFAALVFVVRVECLVDKSLGVVQLVRGRFPKFRSEFPLQEVHCFLVDEDDAVTNRRRQMVYGLGLRLKSGRLIRLSAFQCSGGYTKSYAMARVLERVRLAPAPIVQARQPFQPERRWPAAGLGEKICVLCGDDCAASPRLQDDQGRYYHQSCYAQAYPS